MLVWDTFVLGDSDEFGKVFDDNGFNYQLQVFSLEKGLTVAETSHTE